MLFADVRNFTRLAERLEPRELSALVNELLTALTQVIHRNGGTIDKYMGDAIMAFWGAPLRRPRARAPRAPGGARDAGRAPRAGARGCASAAGPELTIGIGISTGVMRVGHMGSKFRQAYTRDGDAVNLGARIEGLTKQYGVGIAVGEATAAAVPNRLPRARSRARPGQGRAGRRSTSRWASVPSWPRAHAPHARAVAAALDALPPPRLGRGRARLLHAASGTSRARPVQHLSGPHRCLPHEPSGRRVDGVYSQALK